MFNKAAIITVLLVVSAQSATRKEADEKQELEMAETAIVADLALRSTSGTICSEQPALCMSADRLELATALIAARNTPNSLRSLVRLRRFVWDGGYGETYDEYLCKKGRLLEKYLVEVRPTQLHSQCVAEFNAAVKENPKELAKADSGVVCNSVESIRYQISDTLKMVRLPQTSCEP